MSVFVSPMAKLEDVLGTVIVIVIVIISVVSQLIAKVREAQKDAARRKPPAGPQAPEGQGPLADEIEDFLKRATQRRQASAAERPRPPASAPGAAQAPPRRLVEAPVLPGGWVSGQEQPDSVAAHVRDHIGQGKFVPVSQEMGQEVAQIDTDMQRHLEEKFDHRVGRLAAMGGESAQVQRAVDLEAPSQADAAASFSGLAALLASPGSMRQAIILSEVLNRPEHRWS